MYAFMYVGIACMHDIYEHVPIAYSLHSTALGVRLKSVPFKGYYKGSFKGSIRDLYRGLNN